MSLNNAYLCIMSTIRQNKIESVIQGELSQFFQRHAGDICLGAMVSVTVVRVTSDLSLARCYISCFAGQIKKRYWKVCAPTQEKFVARSVADLKTCAKFQNCNFTLMIPWNTQRRLMSC